MDQSHRPLAGPVKVKEDQFHHLLAVPRLKSEQMLSLSGIQTQDLERRSLSRPKPPQLDQFLGITCCGFAFIVERLYIVLFYTIYFC